MDLEFWVKKDINQKILFQNLEFLQTICLLYFLIL